MIDRLLALVRRLQAEQSGAIMLLLLAAFLILFMLALVLYDAGAATQNKMDVQFAADTAAFSHTVIKARSMNLIAYANTIKRMLFSFLATYANAWIAIVVTWLYHVARCSIWHLSNCIEAALSLPMIIAEGIELFITNVPSTSGWSVGGITPSKTELRALENYQQYMFSVTPWWSYVEGTLRGMRNGAYIAGSWPPPTDSYRQVRSVSGVRNTLNAADGVFNTSFAGASPSNNIDVLPAARRDRADDAWTHTSHPFVYDGYEPQSGAFQAGFEYCINYALSLESIVTAVQTIVASTNRPKGWKWVFGITHALPSLGCAFAAFMYNKHGYLDWRIPERLTNNEHEWWQATSSLSLSYKPHAGRNDFGDERNKFTYMRNEATFDRRAFANEGYFGMARSELVYKQPFDELNIVENWVNGVPWVGNFLAQRAGLQDSPDLWSPRWKSKNRPVLLPNERFGSAIRSSDVGFDRVTQDLLPWIALSSATGMFPNGGGPESYTAASAAKDIAYLYRAGGGFSIMNSRGLSK